ncbi:TIGR03435 family protein [Silvibacterium sp.]|uniref:TIGR03435 family protein n=1 Tax=Silvibacterium sp. TaxID=1964179 RepID=UPI0039E3E511
MSIAITASLAMIVTVPSPLQAQRTDAAKSPPAFEVATVKQVDQHKITSIDLTVYPGGHLVIHAHRLAMLIAEAFNIPEWEIIGGDESVLQSWYDIEGKPSPEMQAAIPGSEASWTSIQDAQVRAMLQSLLIERFQLKFHMESRPGTVYELTRSGGPLRLSLAEKETVASGPLEATGVETVIAGQSLAIHRTSMLQLAQKIANVRRTPVIDRTGLPGFYDFTSKTAPTNEDFDNGSQRNMLGNALSEMGLKLVKADGSVEKLVIDSVQLPEGN